MKTAFNASRLAIAAFIVPYIFALNPAMLFINTTAIQVILIVITSFAGMVGISAGLEGYMIRELKPVERVISAAAGLCLIYPGNLTDIIGLAVIAILIVLQLASKKKAAIA